jgi:transcription elongation GreA/GreB family factor
MISVMSPLGASLLGQTPDSLVEYEAPGGIKQVKVLAILNQPEASGNYNG